MALQLIIFEEHGRLQTMQYDTQYPTYAIPMDSLNFDNFHAKLKAIGYSHTKRKAFLSPVYFTWRPNTVAAKLGKVKASAASSHCIIIVV